MTNFVSFSPKQRIAMGWWCPSSGYDSFDAIICDGAVRSGKTLSLSLGFALWAASSFSGASFALCGRSVSAVRRNVLFPLLQHLRELGFVCRDHPSRGYLDLSFAGSRNRFYLFGGRDESSAASIQGITLAGVFLDECALMPRSFVEQAIARCSLPGARLWFSCNPEHPQHWFFTQWIQQAKRKNALYLHFTMDDNPSLSPDVRLRYERLYSGSFYQRFVLGRWVAPEGLVYPMFDPSIHVVDQLPLKFDQFFLSCDYGTTNPMSIGLWGLAQGIWYRMREFYHDARAAGFQCTDEEYYAALVALADGLPIRAVVVDPSAASFIQCIRHHAAFPCIPASNAVAPGIQRVAEWLRLSRLRFHKDCANSIREFSLYRWDDRAARDAPRKEFDHAMDDIRYFVMSASQDLRSSCTVLQVPRKEWR